MKISEVFPRRFATGADLNGKAVTLTISHVQLETMHPHPGNAGENKAVIYFKGAKKGIVLTPALAYKIDKLTGSTDDTDTWKGHRVTLYPVPMTVAGQDRIAIRARAPQASNGQEAPAGLQKEE